MRQSTDEAALNKKKAYLLSVGYRDTPNSCKVKQEITESGVKSNTSFDEYERIHTDWLAMVTSG